MLIAIKYTGPNTTLILEKTCIKAFEISMGNDDG
jgi:hypothetical protein